MSDVSKFMLDSTEINVKDATARSDAAAASALSTANAQDIADLKALSRLTVTYTSGTETITFTSNTHTTTTPTP